MQIFKDLFAYALNLKKKKSDTFSEMKNINL